MYYPNGIERICYEQSHIDQVFEEIYNNLKIYFQKYIDSEGGNYISNDSIHTLADKFGATGKPKQISKDSKIVLERCLAEAIFDFKVIKTLTGIF